MKLRISIITAVLFFILFSNCSVNVKAESEIYFRFNQLGFLPLEHKSAVILSNTKFENVSALVRDARTNKIVFSSLINDFQVYGNFKYSFQLDFSSVQLKGEYYLEIADYRSTVFPINENVYKNVAEKLLDFFKVQRCGYTDPYLHDVCHISDATSLIENGKVINKSMDLTGGWHDAGDYVKFLNTTAFATYMLLFSYDFDPIKFGFDNNKNGTPDILEEAKIGLDWLLRCYVEKNKLVVQVQDLNDHEVGWRLPEDDLLQFNRPAFIGSGKNLIGIYSAALALGARIWRDKFFYKEFSDKCLQTAEKIYSHRNSSVDVDSSGSGMYLDKYFEGKLALGAVELFITSSKENYLIDAKIYADSAGSDYWWSWGDVNSLAHYRLTKFDSKFQDYIKNNLVHFSKTKETNLFGKGVSPTWGTNVTLLGITLQNILWKKLSNDNSFDTVSFIQKDYILGRNPWGLSFIYNVGKKYSKNFHHQISFLKGQLPGGFAAGPATSEFIKGYKIPYEQQDRLSIFQTSDAAYRDDRMDFITNEPTITGNATALFVFGNLKN